MWAGIDFGTCYSSAAIVQRGVALPVRIDYNATALPSSAYVKPDGSLLLGQEAEDLGMNDPAGLQRQIKRDLGSEQPYILRQAQIRPDELVTEILRRLRSHAESQLALDLGSADRSVTNAVVTVPATYGQHRRQAMSTVAHQAGFENVTLLAEPVAAGFYFASQTPDIVKDGDALLVYDLGGGTFDAALIEKQGRSFEPVTLPVGDDQLGGTLFDAKIFEDLRGRAPQALLRQLAGKDGDLIRRRTLLWLEIECRRLKKRLSSTGEARIHFHQDPLNPYVLTRGAFEAMIAPTVAETLELCRRLVASAGLENDRIAGVLLVGGSCRIPYLQNEVARRLELPTFLVDDPALAVSLGAALYGTGLATAGRGEPRQRTSYEVFDDPFGAFQD